MEWATILVQVLGAVGTFLVEAIKAGSIEKALERPLSEILPGELRSVIAKRQADDAAEAKFGAPLPRSPE